MDNEQNDAPDEFREAVVVRETGVAMHGEYPLNSRLRAEALAGDGKGEDPDKLVTPELIADAADRLAREKAEADKAAKAAPSMKWTEKALRDEADRLGVAVTADNDKADILAAIEAAPAA